MLRGQRLLKYCNVVLDQPNTDCYILGVFVWCWRRWGNHVPIWGKDQNPCLFPCICWIFKSTFVTHPRPWFQNGLNMDKDYDFQRCIGLKVKPHQGDGLLFYSMFPNGTIDPVSISYCHPHQHHTIITFYWQGGFFVVIQRKNPFVQNSTLVHIHVHECLCAWFLKLLSLNIHFWDWMQLLHIKMLSETYSSCWDFILYSHKFSEQSTSSRNFFPKQS